MKVANDSLWVQRNRHVQEKPYTIDKNGVMKFTPRHIAYPPIKHWRTLSTKKEG